MKARAPTESDRAGCDTDPGKANKIHHNASPQQGRQCKHDTKVLRHEPSGSMHYGRELCEDCGASLRWVERPGNTEARKLRAARIARLAMVETLSEWKRGFIKSVAKFKKHSPRQIAVIDRMTKDYLKGA